jgi:hypothetical protein
MVLTAFPHTGNKPHTLGLLWRLKFSTSGLCGSQSWWQCSLRPGFVPTCLLGLQVQTQMEALTSVSCGCCVLSGRGLCVRLITRLEESYRVWCLNECDREASIIRRPWPTKGCWVMEIRNGSCGTPCSTLTLYATIKQWNHDSKDTWSACLLYIYLTFTSLCHVLWNVYSLFRTLAVFWVKNNSLWLTEWLLYNKQDSFLSIISAPIYDPDSVTLKMEQGRYSPKYQNKHLLHGVKTQNMTITYNRSCTCFGHQYCCCYCFLPSSHPLCFALSTLYLSTECVNTEFSNIALVSSHHHICGCWLKKKKASYMCKYIDHISTPNFTCLAPMLN